MQWSIAAHGHILALGGGTDQPPGNQGAPTDDLSVVDVVGSACEPWREMLSARADGEVVDERSLRAHLAACAQCRAFEAAITDDARRWRVRAARSMPDLSTVVSARVAVADRRAAGRVVRGLLAVVALFIAGHAAPELVLGEGDESVHAARHLGAFSIAYAVSLLVVVVRPARARAMLPVTAVLAGALFITAVVDVAAGNVPFVDEATHLPELASVALVWLLATPDRRRPGAARTGPHGRPAALRVVPDGDAADRRVG